MPYRTDYQTVPASSTDAVLNGPGGVGRAGDVLERLVIVPLTPDPGVVSIKDGSGPAITLFVGSLGSGTFLVEKVSTNVYLGMRSVNGAWSVTTGANVEVKVAGRFGSAP